MVTGKIDRNAVIAQQSTALSPVTQANGTATVATVAPVAPVAPAAAVEPAKSEFGERSKLLDTRKGEGKAVSTTACASQLWGESGAAGSGPPLNIKNVKSIKSPEAAKKKLAEIEGQQKELAGRMAGRAVELDGKWKHVGLATKTTALHEFLVQTPNLPSETRSEMASAIQLSEVAEEKVDEIRQKVCELPPNKETGKNGTPEERAALAKELWAARSVQSAAVKAATEAVDKAGLKIERLALTENIIDPTAGAKSNHGSMLAMVKKYVELSFMSHTIAALFYGPLVAFIAKLDSESAERKKKDAIEEAWAQRHEVMRRVIREIPVKHEELRNLKVGAARKSLELKKLNLGKS